ncbi:MAG TPA: hypothetical protein V6C85_15985 [Allocoleopsis sp.]
MGTSRRIYEYVGFVGRVLLDAVFQESARQPDTQTRQPDKKL